MATFTASVAPIDELERQLAEINRRPRAGQADHPYLPLPLSAPAIGSALALALASEIGESERFSSPQKPAGQTGPCPRLNRSGDADRRGPLTKHAPR